MPTFLLLVLTSFVSCYASSLIPLNSARSELSLNGSWQVRVGETSTEVHVPANIDFTFGPSVWTRTFTLPPTANYGVVLLSIGGIVNSGIVRVNGIPIGQMSSFTPALFDIKDAISDTGVNTVEITLDDRLTDSTVPGGPTELFLEKFGNLSYTFPIAWANKPGIIRSVSVIYSPLPVMTDVRVDQTFDSNMQKVNLRSTVRTFGALTKDVRALLSFTMDGVLKSQCMAVPVAAGVLQCTSKIANPKLWAPGNPALYEMSAVLIQTGLIADAGRDRIGVRKFEARGPRFYLNNEPIMLKGISRHDIYGANHFVADDATIQSDLSRIRALGVNFIRTIHYPPDELFLRRADEYGLLVSEELPAWANLARPEVINTAYGMLQSIIDRDSNRASLVMYFVATISQVRPDAYLDTLIQLAKTDQGRVVSFLFDDATFKPEQIAANVEYARNRGAQFYAQNCYWHSSIFATGEPYFPTDMPFLDTEWSGAEGSDRGPLGTAGAKSFPDNTGTGDGIFSESFEALRMAESFEAFYPYLCSATRTVRCLAGTVYFNWQDVDWPGMPYFYPGHYPIVRNGLVYEDRTEKQWPIAVFGYTTQLY